jgi:peroxiredoxin
VTPSFPAPEKTGKARHLVRGRPMPDIALAATSGGTISLAGRPGWVILFVYPWTGRPGVANPPDWDQIPGAHGSTPEAEGYRNLHRAFRDMETEVLGLSAQASDWQRELVDRLALPYQILSDEKLELQAALALPTFETGGTVYLERLTLALKDGCIERVFHPVHPPEAHPREVLAWLDEIVSRRPGR